MSLSSYKLSPIFPTHSCENTMSSQLFFWFKQTQTLFKHSPHHNFHYTCAWLRQTTDFAIIPTKPNISSYLFYGFWKPYIFSIIIADTTFSLYLLSGLKPNICSIILAGTKTHVNCFVRFFFQNPIIFQ